MRRYHNIVNIDQIYHDICDTPGGIFAGAPLDLHVSEAEHTTLSSSESLGI